jgi:asparagine synthase (glutamine-hydrolysing)
MLGSRHTSIELNPTSFAEALPRIVAAVEEPIATSSIVPMYLVSQRARQDVKVVLVGQGPDELFGGYNRHLGMAYSQYWANLPAWLRSPITGAISRLPRNEMLKRGVYSLHVGDRLRRFERTFSLVPDETMNEMFHDGLISPGAASAFLEGSRELEEFMAGTDELGAFQLMELRSSLPDELLMYGDKLSMAHGLEARVPYLDREVVEWVQRLDASFKVRHLARKWLHKRVCSGVLPKTIVRRKKQGFGVNVVDGWFRDASGSPMKNMLLDRSSLIYRFLRPATIARLLREHESGEQDNHKVLFSVVVFEEWLRLHADAAQPAPLTSTAN